MSQPTPNKSGPPRLLITAGPTHEPIDAVRFLGNRSSGRVGSALADEAARRGWPVRVLMGPAAVLPESPLVDVHRYRSTTDLELALAEHLPWCDVLLMAAAVSDFRPVIEPGADRTKWRRGKERMTLELEPTPDLLAGCAARRREGQVLIGFALEPRSQLTDSARAKLERKNIDFIVANPLETMDADSIAATLFARGGEAVDTTDGEITKADFAAWLVDRIEAIHADTTRRSTSHRLPE